jgi:malonate-semialdehyde dehydrogenase (acetylating)/methylmalonate-semialdehyde dehydrogenase
MNQDQNSTDNLHWVGGKSWEGTSGEFADLRDPATGAVSGRVALASAADVDQAVQTAALAGREWAATSLAKRSAVLFAFRELVSRHTDELARVITAQHGKVLSDAAGEVARGLEVADFACGIPHLLKGGYSSNVSTGVDSHSIRQPLGVVAGISPFNFPVMVPMWMHPVAIACGNAFVLKPSERDPSVSTLVAELWAQAGLPDGVFSVVNGDRRAVEALLAHPDVAAVSFVGSTPVARTVAQEAVGHGKRFQALGGAKNHMVVLPDADVDAAADAAVSAGFGSAGERCMAVSVVVAVGAAADPFVAAVQDRIGRLQVGPGTEPGSDMGPLITAAHRDRVARLVGSGIAEGATPVVDGRDVQVAGHPDGFWLGPTLLDHVTPAMEVYREEVFGPVLQVVRVETYDEALALVNANPYGNGTAIFTNDGWAARRFQEEVEVGMVGINVSVPVPMAYYSFGGWKQSLFGDLHVHGQEGVQFYTRGKAVTSRWLAPSARRGSGVDLGFPTNA